MTDYYKIYHYSAVPSLDKIDPKFFGTGVCYAAYKRGGLGIPKSYYFISTTGKLPDASGRPYRYELYIPCDWKIYDLDKDPNKFIDRAKKEIAAEKLYPYNWLVNEKVETYIKEAGYAGRLHADGIAIAIFCPLEVKKPEGPGRVFEFSAEQKKENLLEELPSPIKTSTNEKNNSSNVNYATLFYASSVSTSEVATNQTNNHVNIFRLGGDNKAA